MCQATPHVDITPYNAKTPVVVATAANATAALTDICLPPAAACLVSSGRSYSLAAGLNISAITLRAIMLRLSATK